MCKSLNHQEYIHIVKEAKTAVLFVHGILGTPAHFEFLSHTLPKDISVYNMLLKGHGGSPKEFSKASMLKWRQQVDDAAKMLLSSHQRLIICAHSMGTLFGIQQAIKNPDISLFLMNPPLVIRPKAKLAKATWRIYQGKIPQKDEWLLGLKRSCSIQIDKNIFHYAGWIPRYLELFGEICKTRKLVPKLSSSCKTYLSNHDELVSVKSAKYFAKNNNSLADISLKFLETSGHFFYSKKDKELLIKDFRETLCYKD